MPRPLYPPRKGPKEPTPDAPLWQNPYLLLSGGGVLFLVVIVGWHLNQASQIVDPTLGPAAQRGSGGVFSFLQDSFAWKKKSLELESETRELEGLGIPSGTATPFAGAKPEDYREQRRLFAFQKYEGGRQLMEERVKEREEFRRKMNNPAAGNLKDALLSLENSDNLGIMKLEGLLNQELLKSGGQRENLDLLIYAFQNLAEVYARKNMREKSKEAYVNSFRLLKEKAPDEQGPSWDKALGEVENLQVKGSGN